MFIETITYAADKVKNTWAYLETVMPASYNELNDMVMKLVENNNLLSTIYAKINSPVFTGEPKAPTPAVGDNTTKISTTAWVTTNIQSLVSSCIAAVATSAGFAYLFETNGYIKLPSWLGGLIIQWGHAANISAGAATSVTLPVAFPTSGIIGFMVSTSNTSSSSPVVWEVNTTTIILDYVSSSATAGANWLAIGH